MFVDPLGREIVSLAVTAVTAVVVFAILALLADADAQLRAADVGGPAGAETPEATGQHADSGSYPNP